MDIRTIVVPFDFSEPAEKAFLWALEMAERWVSRIFVLHVVPTPLYPSLMSEATFGSVSLDASLRADAEDRLEEFVKRAGKKPLLIDMQVVIGEPFADICRVAEERKADLIIMGSHGRTGLSHILLGSVAERVVRHAPCPVLVVGKRAHT